MGRFDENEYQESLKQTIKTIHDEVAKEQYGLGYKQGKIDEREHILEILHGIDRQIENLVICVLGSECVEEEHRNE